MSLVSLVANTGSSFSAAIEKSVDLIKFDFSPNLQNVVIKPDVCYYWDHSTGQTTDPNFVAGLIHFLKERVEPNLEILLVASDTPLALCRDLFRFLGYEKMAKEENVKLVNLSEDGYEEVNVRVANQSFMFQLPNFIKNADLFVDVPKMKWWLQTGFSCGLKNIYDSSLPNMLNSHPFLDKAIVAANKIMSPDLCLVDGIMVRGKRTKKLGLVMSSTDPVAVDSAAAKIAGLNPKSIRHIVLAEREGLGTIEYKAVGESVPHFAQFFPRKNFGDKIWSMITSLGLVTLRKLGRNADFA